VIFKHDAWILFFALFALYSPVAALSSYLPYVRPYSNPDQIRLGVGLAVNASIFVLVAIWAGEPLLKLLGVTTAALTATGGIALIFASVPLMRGQADPPPDDSPEGEAVVENAGSWKSVLLTPVTFPLTVGGTTFAFGVAASAEVGTWGSRGWLSIAAVGYGVVTGLTLYASGHVARRVSYGTLTLLDRFAGILLTAIAVILLANGFTDLVVAALPDK
jgi:multiple antibiotic resistance protein